MHIIILYSLIFSALPKVIERSWGLQCIEIIPTSLNLSLQRNHKSFLFAFLCHSPLFTTASSFPQALQGPAWQAFLVYFSFHRTLHTVGNKEYTEAGMWPKKRRERYLLRVLSHDLKWGNRTMKTLRSTQSTTLPLVHADWWDVFALDKIIWHYQSNETSLAYLKHCTILFLTILQEEIIRFFGDFSV